MTHQDLKDFIRKNSASMTTSEVETFVNSFISPRFVKVGEVDAADLNSGADSTKELEIQFADVVPDGYGVTQAAGVFRTTKNHVSPVEVKPTYTPGVFKTEEVFSVMDGYTENHVRSAEVKPTYTAIAPDENAGDAAGNTTLNMMKINTTATIKFVENNNGGWTSGKMGIYLLMQKIGDYNEEV